MSMGRREKYKSICERAESGERSIERMSLLMDIESADKRFNLRLDDWLKADDFEFFHDIYGIMDNIVRDDFPAISFGHFIPRFAS